MEEYRKRLIKIFACVQRALRRTIFGDADLSVTTERRLHHFTNWFASLLNAFMTSFMLSRLKDLPYKVHVTFCIVSIIPDFLASSNCRCSLEVYHTISSSMPLYVVLCGTQCPSISFLGHHMVLFMATNQTIRSWNNDPPASLPSGPASPSASSLFQSQQYLYLLITLTLTDVMCPSHLLMPKTTFILVW